MRRFFLLFSLMLVLLTGCGSQPPVPKLSVDGEAIEFQKGSYSWSSFGRSTIADAPAPPFLVRKLEPKLVTPGSELEFRWSRKPNSVVLSQWMEADGLAEEVQQVVLKGDSYPFPEESGEYIYSLRAEWSNGSAIYAFVVQIE